jgi:hypothetical protein
MRLDVSHFDTVQHTFSFVFVVCGDNFLMSILVEEKSIYLNTTDHNTCIPLNDFWRGLSIHLLLKTYVHTAHRSMTIEVLETVGAVVADV